MGHHAATTGIDLDLHRAVTVHRQVPFLLDVSMCRNTENALLEGPCGVLTTSAITDP
jgi:hypothetical protein